MPRTLLITAFYPPLLGGLEHYWKEVARRWPKNDLIVLTQPAKDHSKSFDEQGIAVIRKPFFPLRYFRPSWVPLVKTIARISSKNNIDRLLFGHFANYALTGLILKKTKGLPYDIMTHGVDSVLPMRSTFGAWSLRRVFYDANTLYANSEQTGEYIRSIVKRPVRIAPPGIDFSDYPDRSRDEVRARNRWGDKFMILFVGRLVAVKGVDILLRAVSELSNDIDYKLIIVGTGPEQTNLMNLSKVLKIEDRVMFIGEIPDDPMQKSNWYAGVDVVVMPSHPIHGHRESFGIVCLEAARYALPVIMTDSCGAKELIQDERTGHLIRSNNIEDLRRALCSIWKKPADSKEQGLALAKLVREKYTWDATVKILAHTDD